MPDRVRIQSWRVPGGRKPDNVVIVARPSRWGNRFVIGATGVPDAAAAVDLFRAAVLLTHWGECNSRAVPSMIFPTIMEAMPGPIPRLEAIRQHLRGRDLACYCPLDAPCHADVLLELANREAPDA